MLSFTNRAITPQTLLANTNELVKFTPNEQTNNTLTITQDGKIQVTTRQVIPSQAYEVMSRLGLRLNNPENHDAFAQEKMILIWHCTQLLPYLLERLEHLQAMPKDNLLEYHDLSVRFQGFYQLCNNLSLQIAALNQLINDAEMPQKKNWSIQFKFVQNQLNTDMEKLLASAREFITLITQSRKRLLSAQAQVFDFQMAPQPHLTITTRQMPLNYEIGSLFLANKSFKVEAHFETYRSTWDTPTRFPFSGKICIDISEAGQKLHTSLNLYPSRSYGVVPQAKASNDVRFPQDCATGYLNDLYERSPYGTIPLEPVVLCASFTHLCEHVKTNEMLPFMVTLLDIAQAQNILNVTVYAPYNYSAILGGLGFKPTTEDKAHPTKAEIIEIINTCMDQGSTLPLLAESLNRSTQDGDPILRPFCLDLGLLEYRPVYLTSQRKKTSYAELIGKGVLNRKAYPKGIIPEVHQIPLSISDPQALFMLRQREITGKTTKPTVFYGMESVDYKRLDKDESLKEVAYADPVRALESQFSKMLTLKRK